MHGAKFMIDLQDNRKPGGIRSHWWDNVAEGMLRRKRKPINQPGVTIRLRAWASSSKCKAERTVTVLEASPTDG